MRPRGNGTQGLSSGALEPVLGGVPPQAAGPSQHLSCPCSEPNLLVRACNQLGQFLQHRETNLRYLALESMCTLASSEFSHEAVKTHIETVTNALKASVLIRVPPRCGGGGFPAPRVIGPGCRSCGELLVRARGSQAAAQLGPRVGLASLACPRQFSGHLQGGRHHTGQLTLHLACGQRHNKKWL